MIDPYCSQIRLVKFRRAGRSGPLGLRRRSAAARLLKWWVRIPPRAWMSVCFECCVLSGRGLCDELITRPEESYRLWYAIERYVETSLMRRSWPIGGCCAENKMKFGVTEGLTENARTVETPP